MPRERQIRQATGRTRKTTLRRTQQEYRAQRGLNSAQTDLRTLHQHEILSHDALQATINRGQVNLLSSLDDQNNSEEEEEIHEDLEVLDDSLLLSQFARADLLHQESIHFDVHNEEKNEYKDPSHRTIAEFDDRTARAWTGFDKDQLTRISGQFNMEGEIKLKGYNFTKEEIFLFSSSKIYLGLNNTRLCELCFGGHPKRWSAAFKWYLKFLDLRYHHILNVVGLDREKHNFPMFARAIARKINMLKEYLHPVTGERIVCKHLTLFDEYLF